MPSLPRHLLLLTLLWALATLPGLNSVGLINWQESTRALAAHEMHQRSDWLIPTIANRPYLAKPPMFYWCQLALCKLTGQPPTEHTLRYTVALAGLAGILLTYLAARSTLARALGDEPAREHLAQRAALWSAAMLATGILYLRSSRTGELDILLAPFTIAAIWTAAWLFLNHHLSLSRKLLPITLGSLACAAAALTKGPPALLPIAIGAAGGAVLATLWRSDAFRPSAYHIRTLAAIGAALALLASLLVNRAHISSSHTWLGAALLGACGLTLGLLAPILANPRSILDAARGLWRTAIIPMLAIGAAALWSWSRAVESRLGPEVIARTLNQEAADNLRLLSPDAPIQNFEAIAYGVGAGSFACMIALIWLLAKRPRIHPAWWFPLAWLSLSLFAFSILGRGTGRYLTPLWPAIAILGGIWTVRAIRDLTIGRHLARILCAAILILATAQSAWYTFKRPLAEGQRSPRDLLAELLGPPHNTDPTRLVALDFWIASLDFYTGRHVEPISDLGPWIDYPHDETPLPDLVARLRADPTLTYTLLARATPAPITDALPESSIHLDPLTHLRDAGLTIEEIPLASNFLLDRQRTQVKAYRLRSVP
ncbi:MAG: hypothetical protein IT435_00530 [Phycisphaerales bacterium]|nr:hypothetical protein [Phycisphaerales bacterium]